MKTNKLKNKIKIFREKVALNNQYQTCLKSSVENFNFFQNFFFSKLSLKSIWDLPDTISFKMGVYLSKFSNWLYDSKWLRIFSILFSNRWANQITNLIHQLRCRERWFWFRVMCTFYIQGWRLLRLVCSGRYLAVLVIILFWYMRIPKNRLKQT